jgi:methylated-DNA-[protein]-cysteine S-methyltransferase
MYYNVFPSQIGNITLVTDGKSLTELHIEDDKYFVHIPKEWEKRSDDPILNKAQKELEEYFAKKRVTFTIPLEPKGTAFQHTVWNALREIPSGTTQSYMDIAKKIHKPEAIRAVGSAVGRNPLCIFIPCHRVMGSDGKFHGYVAGVERKKFLLELEGMKFGSATEQLGLDILL